jgi:mycothiol synthase
MMNFTIHHLHPYQGRDELPKLLQFVGECNALAHFCGYLHPGDLGHFLSAICRGRDLEKHCFVQEDAEGTLLGLVLLYPARFNGYDVLMHPRARGSELESTLIAWSEQEMLAKLQAGDGNTSWMGSDVMDCDIVRRDILQAQGYVSTGEPTFFYTTRSLLQAIPEPLLPEGFRIRHVAGEHEAEAVRIVHASAFPGRWQPGEYLNVMRTPGFHVDRELMVVAPDGRFAAFLVYWIDPVSKSGLFEPVGCHPDFQRRGLTKALLYAGMRRMLASGMTTAVVKHEAPQENPAAAALYRSVGFTLKYTISDYRKQVK